MYDIQPVEPLEGWEHPPFEAKVVGDRIIAKEVWRAVFIANLNPYIGFLHARRPGRISLVYDLMEEFRQVVVDRPLIKAARK